MQVAEVVGGVLLGAGVGRAQQGHLGQQVGEDEPQVRDVAGCDVADLVPDHEPQRVGIADRAADLEQVGVDRDEAPEPVPCGESVDHAIAQHHVRVGHPPQTELEGGLGDHPVALRELGRAHPHRLDPQLGEVCAALRYATGC